MNYSSRTRRPIDGLLYNISSVALLGLRLILAFGFYSAARNHWSDMSGTIYFFDQVLGIPLPAFNAYLATLTEFAGVLLLTLGLFTRWIAIPLIITMIVAIVTAHWGNGFVAFESIPANSFLFSESGNILGTASGVEIFHEGIKVGNVDTVATGGMEIPVTYIVMLLMLIGKGAGMISMDQIFFKKKTPKQHTIFS